MSMCSDNSFGRALICLLYTSQEWRAAFKKRFEELAEYENWEEALFESAQEGKKE